MRKVAIAGAGLLILGTVSGLALMRSSSEPASPADTLAFLDPAQISQSLCGKQGQERGLFFRPEFRMALAPAAHAEEAAAPEVPLWEGLGDYQYQVTTKNLRAQAYFNQGFRLTYAFNHWEAARAFRQAQKIDPTCAMCYWGEALVLGPNINAPMEADAIAPAFAAAAQAQAQAQALASGASPEEQALIAALAKRYSADPEADRAALDQAYADAMADVYAAYPDDQDIASLYAEAQMDLSPWDYWERDFTTAKAHIKPAIAAIEGVLAKNPDHPGAIHFYIHLMEPSKMPAKAEPYADRLAALMPAAGHLVHMPGHTYFRIGRYIDALKTNVAAVAADRAYLAQVQGSDIYRYGYYPHNVHFVLVSAQMAGDEETALDFARQLDELIPIEAATEAAWIQPIKVAPWFAYLQFGSADDVFAIPAPPDSTPYIRAIWHYVRGAAYAMAGREAEAKAEAEAIRKLQTRAPIADMEKEGVPATDLLNIAALVVEARVAQKAGNLDDAIAKLEKAADLQVSLIYSEPPFWYYPVEQTLGALLLKAGRADEAAAAFTSSLVLHPNNAWSLYGLMKAQEAAGDPAAKTTAKLYKKASLNPTDVDLDRL